MENAHNIPYENILKSMMQLLRNQNPTEEDIRTWVDNCLSGIEHPESINRELLINELTANLILFTDYKNPDIFEDENPSHEIWLGEDQKKSIKWLYWDRYTQYLADTGWKPEAIHDIDRRTEDILSRMENPYRPGSWATRGMVVGYIQSGKTANYTGLICKAADAGYKLIIVLAGIHKDLRYQTQVRIDSGFIGTEKKEGRKKPVGVGNISRIKKNAGGEVPMEVNCLTDSTIDGDFKRPRTVNRITISANGSPFCLVVKKNSSVLKNVNEWINDLTVDSQIPGKVADIPLLLIDDEADNASLNTKKYESSSSQEKDEITTINKCIRDILNKFHKSAYVGYTATPYANVFIDPDARSDKYGADIFPRDFIISMREPPGYFGSGSAFGSLPGTEINDDTLFPGIVIVNDDGDMIPEDKRSDPSFVPTQLSGSLRTAIVSFILACAVRDVRNEGVNKTLHNSMLIHVSRYIAAHGLNASEEDMQSGLSRLVHRELETLDENLALCDNETIDKFFQLWNSSFHPASLKIRAKAGDPLCTDISWKQVCSRLGRITHSIKVKTLNGANSEDTLDYAKYGDGLNVIAIGGDKLSRGLTLEGLTTSYFLRSAQTYDSLLQMGRWFGFRLGYIDLCRIYTTKDLIRKFRLINDADEHLRDQIRRMDDADRTPEKYGLKIKQNDPRFRITQQNKMRTGERQVGNPYSGSLKQTYKFNTNPDVIMENFRVIDQFISELCSKAEPGRTGTGGYIWKNVSVDVLLKHLPSFQNHPDQLEMGTDLYQYIFEQQGHPERELTNWTVVLMNTTSGNPVTGKIAGLDVGYSIRNPPENINPDETGEYEYSKHQILNDISEEALDLTKPQIAMIYREMMEDYEAGRRKRDGKKIRSNAKKPEYGKPNGFYCRLHRPVTNGLLLIYPITWQNRTPRNATPLIGLAYSFPLSNTALSDEYITNKTYQATWMNEDD